ncbi:unnamed protein product [Spirodela intermedia]|uniref:Uncharacterized protein n=1 Tax=Spirodela intermedia TaxID=51605 RepID=A0A7I8K6Q2_SPIIN|nr:unnamed protein product [Spirodela intermedia]
MKLGEWCERNTKRPEFLEIIPGEMWDLVESAEEALQHEFFAPCRDVLRKQRLLRQSSGHRSL